MVKPEKKLKKILLIMGITGAVYGGFRYLLPLVIPFLLAYGTALFLRPSARFFAERLKIRLRNKEFHAPVWFAGGVELLFLLGGFFGILFLVGSRLIAQLRLFILRFPEWIWKLDRGLTGLFLKLERLLGFHDRYLVGLAQDAVKKLPDFIRGAAMPAIMSNSVSVAQKAVQTAVFLFLYAASVILCLREMEEIREKRSASFFHRELSILGRRLASVGSAWIKTQLFLMVMTSVLCIAGLFLIGNPYFVLLGLGIGLLDALPVFGVGSVLLPWAFFSFLGRQWGKGAALLFLYLICYFLREFTEAKMMGDKVGLSPLNTLISMYVGFELFGFPGFLLGPMGLLLIRDLTELYGE